MGTAQLSFAEDPDDLTIAHGWPEVTTPEVTWLFPLLFLPYYFPDFFPVLFFPFFPPVLFFPVFFSCTFFPYFFLSSSTKCWLGCSLRRPRFSPYFFPRTIFSRNFVLVVVQIVGWGCFLRRPHFFPSVFFRTFFSYFCFPNLFYPYFLPYFIFRTFFLAVVRNVGWGCSLLRPHLFP